MVRQNEERMTCECPQGHRLRGPVSLIGKQIHCPKCQSEFIFGETYRLHVSDTTVMRILGEGPKPVEPPEELETRPCQRCGVAIPAAATVCDCCECYMGSLPDFMKSLRADVEAKRS